MAQLELNGAYSFDAAMAVETARAFLGKRQDSAFAQKSGDPPARITPPPAFSTR